MTESSNDLPSPFPILYEDNHLLVVVKPSGLLTQSTDLESDSLENLAKAWLKEKYNKPFNVFLGVVHRLDRAASGIVLFAKTSKALSRLNEIIRSKDAVKVYLAQIEGKMPAVSGELEHFLRHDEFLATVSNRKDPQAKFAKLYYDEVKRIGKVTLLQIILETGRYHQIRAQLSAVGCPIVGDTKYGSKAPLAKGVVALHHYRLQLIHPVTKQHLSFEAPPPAYFGLV